MNFEQWNGFVDGEWRHIIDVRDFIQRNYTPYHGDDAFLKGATERTKNLTKKFYDLCEEEKKAGGVLDIDTEHVASPCSYAPGYLDKENELIVGVQTDAPLKRGVHPFGGIRMARDACKAYGYELSQKVEDYFRYRTTHNDGVFRIYTDEMRAARHCALLTGLPDAYGRGRIIGDYRRVALYGIDALIEKKKEDKRLLGLENATADSMNLLEELYKQIEFLGLLKEMAKMYGFDISRPAENAKEAIQWTYFGYLGANKEQNGAAMSFGRTSTFFDIYIERDIKAGILTEETAQELIDDLVLKLRMCRHLRTPEYNELFGGDPMWITESVGGMGEDNRTLVTKTSFRMLNTLRTLGPAPEPNLTVLWSYRLPEGFKKFCAELSIETDAIQYENDDLMRNDYGDDYAIACCVSAMKIGKQMQFFGARTNLAKLLLLTLNGGTDNVSGTKIGPQMDVMNDEVLNFDSVMERFRVYLAWLCKLYVNTMNTIHFMHDKYAYERTQMALHNTYVQLLMAFGVAGLSVIDDLIRDTITELRKTPTYRDAKHTLSVLTITSNVVYGKKTGATPDGRKKGEPFAPGANPMHNREVNGALASLNSVAKLSYCDARDGISNTFSIVPEALGNSMEDRVENLVSILNGYFLNNAHHINVNVLNRETLLKAYEHPEDYPNLTIRVSGYAVNFCKLSREQQKEVIMRTFHESV